MRISELLYWTEDTIEGNRTHPKLDFRPTSLSDALTNLARALKKDGQVNHFGT